MGMHITEVGKCLRSELFYAPVVVNVGVYAWHGEHASHITEQSLLELSGRFMLVVLDFSIYGCFWKPKPPLIVVTQAVRELGFGIAPSS